MKSTLMRSTPLLLFSLGGTASGQVAEVTFIDGGYTEMCEQAARRTERPSQPLEFVELTGSRLGIPPEEICTIAIREDPSPFNRAGNYNNRGVLRFADGRLEEALQDFDRAVELQRDLGRAHINRGFTLVGMERWGEAVEAFDRGLALGVEESARAHFSRAIAHEELGHVREAYLDYRAAAELDPEWEAPRLEMTRFRVGS